MIAKGHKMSVKDETGYTGDRSSKTMGIEPMNATFHPVGEWMKDSELEWEMLCFVPYKNGWWWCRRMDGKGARLEARPCAEVGVTNYRVPQLRI